VTEIEQVAREFYRLVSAGDYAGVLTLLAEDIVWTIPGPSVVPYAGVYHGKAEVVEFFRILAANEDLHSFTPEAFIIDEPGGIICVLGSENAVAVTTGKAFSARWAEVFHVMGGRISKFEQYIDTFALAEAYSAGP
jgi:ketosteroid isomerase-like protein